MSDDLDPGAAHEPLEMTAEHSPPSWFGPTAGVVPCEITRLRAQNAELLAEIGGLRLRMQAMELSYRAALADRDAEEPVARVVAPIGRALAARPVAYGLRTGLEF